VRDFLHWHYAVDWPVFNVADCCLVIGAGLLLLQAFQAQPDAEEELDESEVAPTGGAEYASAAKSK